MVEGRQATLPSNRAFVTDLISSLADPSISTAQTPASTANVLKALPQSTRSTLLTLHVLFPNELLAALDLLDRNLVTRLIPATDLDSPGPELHEANHPPDPIASSQHAPPPGHSSPPAPQQAPQRGKGRIYHVRTSQVPSQHSHYSKRSHRDTLASSTFYSVSPVAWNCSCPAFTFSAFPPSSSSINSSSSSGGAAGAAVPIFEGFAAWRAAQPDPQPQHHRSGHELEAESAASPWPVQGGQRVEWTAGGLSLGSDLPMCKHLLAVVLVECTSLFSAFVEERAISKDEVAGWGAGWGG